MTVRSTSPQRLIHSHPMAAASCAEECSATEALTVECVARPQQSIVRPRRSSFVTAEEPPSSPTAHSSVKPRALRKQRRWIWDGSEPERGVQVGCTSPPLFPEKVAPEQPPR